MSFTVTGSLEAAIGRLRSLHDVTVTVGLQGSLASAAPGESTATELVSIAERLHVDRPFLTHTLKVRGARWAKRMIRAAALRGRGDVAGSALELRRVGLVAVADVQHQIRRFTWKPNAPSTIAAKGSSKPLIDTGQLVQSIRSAVEVPGRPPEVVG